MKTKTFSPREAALSILLSFEGDALKATIPTRNKADVMLNRVLSQQPHWGTQERAFASALVYGVLRHWFQLDQLLWWGLKRFDANLAQSPSKSQLRQALKACDIKLRTLLRMGLFQAFWLNSVPDYAGISSTMSLADGVRLGIKQKQTLNGLLANATQEVTHARIKAQIETWALWPVNWRETLQTAYDSETISAMMEACTMPPEGLGIRINTLKTGIAEYRQLLSSQGIPFESPTNENLAEYLWLPHFSGSPTQLPGFEDGLLYIQDLSSALASTWLDVQPGQRVLDLCAAPGSKTTHMAARMENKGDIVAIESQAKRLAQLTDNCARLGVTCVTSVLADALSWAPDATETFDRILVDTPCSGTGTIRHQPDSLLQWRAGDASEYHEQQFNLLSKASQWLKPGGKLLYSTCSLDPKENTDVVQRFLATHPDWRCTEQHQQPITPQQDGFFGSVLTRK